MKLLTKALGRFILVNYDVIKNTAGAVMVAITMIMSVDIVSRYMFPHAISWIEEICRLLLVWLCYLSASPTIVTKEHVVVGSLFGPLPANMQKVLGSMICIGETIFFEIVTYSVIRLPPELANVSAALKLLRYWYYLPVLMFGVYMALTTVVDMVNGFVSGYDYFGQRKEEKERAYTEQKRKENLEMLKRVSAFMGIGNEEGKGK